MALVFKDRVRMTTTTTGTGTLTLGSAVTGFQAFSAIGDGNTCYFCIEAIDSNGIPTGDWEVSLGTYTSAGTTLSRTTTFASSNSGSAVNLSAGTKHVIVVSPARILSALIPADVSTNYALLDGLTVTGANIASATTTDIGAATGESVTITGTTTITGLGTKAAGVLRFVTFSGALLLTHNATSLILPSGANITTAADDTAIFLSLGSGNWRCLSYNRKTGAALVSSVSTDGWTSDANTWTYASADSPTFTLTVNADLTSVINVGNKIKLTQTTVKYFVVTAISYSAPNTTITIYGGTDYTLANAAISSPYYSHAKGPVGFPLSPIKWTVTVTDTQDKEKTTPTVNVWYGGANAWSTGSNVSISVPIGTWRMSYSLYQYVLDTSATIVTMETTLSSSDSSESDEELTASIGGNGASSTMTVRQTTRASKVITVASKTPYYLIARTETVNMDSINWALSNRAAIITAECVFL